MTLIVALIIAALFPVSIMLLKMSDRHRPVAFLLLGLLPFLTNLPLIGFIYGWAGWNGTARGIFISLIDDIALALILTRPRTRGALPFWPVIGIYGLALTMSAIASSVWVASVFSCWQLVCVGIVFAAVGGECHRPELRAAVWKGLALGLLYEMFFVLFQKLSGVVQAPGTLGHQNILGLMLELALLPLAAALLAGIRGKLLILGVIAALICAAGTGSRATLGILTGSLIVLIVLSTIRRSTSRKLVVAFSGIAILALASPFALNTLNHRFRGASYVTEEEERKSFESAAVSMADRHPLGVGANQFVLVSNRDGYAERAGVPWQAVDRSMPVHNAYLLARAETGWFGELAFILLLFYPIIRGARLAFGQRKDPLGDLALGSVVALSANALHDRYEFASHTFPVQCVMFINIALIAALIRARQLDTGESLSPKMYKRIVPLVGPRSLEARYRKRVGEPLEI